MVHRKKLPCKVLSFVSCFCDARFFMEADFFLLKTKTKRKNKEKKHEKHENSSRNVMSGRNSQPGNGNNCICGGWRQPLSVTITTYNYENEPVEMTFEKAPEKVFAYANSNIEELLALGLGDKIVAACGLDGDVREDLKDEFDKIQYMDTKPSKEEVVAMEPDFIAAWYSSFSDDWLSDVSFWQERNVNTYMSLNSAAKGPASEFHVQLKTNMRIS